MGVDLLRRAGVADVVDLEVEVDEAAEVRVWSIAILLELDVGGFPCAGEGGYVGDHLHLLIAAALLVEVLDGDAGVLCAGEGCERENGGGNGQSTHGGVARRMGKRGICWEYAG